MKAFDNVCFKYLRFLGDKYGENLTYVYTNYTSSLITNNIFTKLESHNNYNK